MIEKRVIAGTNDRYYISELGDVFERTSDGYVRISAWIEGIDYQCITLVIDDEKIKFDVQELIDVTWHEKIIPKKRFYLKGLTPFITDDQAVEVMRMVNSGMNYRNVSKHFGVKLNVIESVVVGRTHAKATEHLRQYHLTYQRKVV